jgi:hypothetical protein
VFGEVAKSFEPQEFIDELADAKALTRLEGSFLFATLEK